MFLIGWREKYGAKMWSISLQPYLANVQPCNDNPEDPDNIQVEDTIRLFGAYALTSIAALVKYLHTEAAYLVRDNWLKTIKAGNNESWLGLTYNSVDKYFPSADETTKGHMVQTCQKLYLKSHTCGA